MNVLGSREWKDSKCSPAASHQGVIEFENEGVVISSVLLMSPVVLSASFVRFRREQHGAFVYQKVVFVCVCARVCVSKKPILFISSRAVISAAGPLSIMCSQEAESRTTVSFQTISTQFHLFILTTHAVKDIHLCPVGGGLFVF